MDIIPFARFAFSIFIFGLMFAVFSPILEYVTGFDNFSAGLATTEGTLLMLFWVALPLVNLFVQGVLLLMTMQKRSVNQ